MPWLWMFVFPPLSLYPYECMQVSKPRKDDFHSFTHGLPISIGVYCFGTFHLRSSYVVVAKQVQNDRLRHTGVCARCEKKN